MQDRVTFDIALSVPDSFRVFTNRSGRSIQAIRVRTAMKVNGTQVVATLNTGLYLNEDAEGNVEPNLGKPKAQVFTFAPEVLTDWDKSVRRAIKAFPGYDKATREALVFLKTDKAAAKAAAADDDDLTLPALPTLDTVKVNDAPTPEPTEGTEN